MILGDGIVSQELLHMAIGRMINSLEGELECYVLNELVKKIQKDLPVTIIDTKINSKIKKHTFSRKVSIELELTLFTEYPSPQESESGK